MAYIALYRKYRSQNFGELMGQESITTTLQNAIRSRRIAHAYLFYGARGCGKTSTARLVAKALNCIGPDGTLSEPTPEPCGVCRLCTAIRDGNCMDVIEMDAASETGINDVREKIIENVQYAPGEGRYKVYIIDEVHDLSAKAFDALLKTLEEPPPHVVFILATTEQQKVPITIQSRCQSYQFKRGSLEVLSLAVKRVIEDEGCTADGEAIESIARSAEGSWRDALSLLEQVLAYSEGHVTGEIVHKAIGTVGSETLARVTQTLALGDWSATLAIAADLVDSGKDARQLLTALSGHLRDLMLISAGAKQAAMQELGVERFALLLPQAALFDPPALLAMMGILSAAEREIRFVNQHRWILERALLHLMQIGQGSDATGYTGQSATLSALRPAGTVRPGNASVTVSALQSPPARDPIARVSGTPAVPPTPSLALAALEETSETDGEAEEEEEETDAPATAPVVAVPALSADLSSPPNLNVGTETPPEPEQSASVPANNEHRFADAVTLDVIKRAWPRIKKMVKQTSPSGGNFLESAEVAALDGKIVVLSFADSFSRDRIQNKGRELVERKINEAMGAECYKIRCVLKEDLGEGGSAVPVKSVPPTSPSNGALEMPTLLEAPLAMAQPDPSASIMDFDRPAPAPPPSAAPINGISSQGANGNHQNETAGTSVPPSSEVPTSNGLLKEVLDLFGGQVVRVEP